MSLALPGELASSRLANGLEVHLLRNADAPVVTTALTYRVGSRHEPRGRSGIAHFLEHMMFKGSLRFGPGEIDQRTRALGGSNNAFTTHDTTTYYFSFAAGVWEQALAIEADRMQGLENAAHQVESERSVILEELAMYEAEPWDALDRRVQSTLFGEHPYGRPIIGCREDVGATSAADLADFHRRHYRPDNAVLIVAGAIEETALDRVSEAFEAVMPADVAALGTIEATDAPAAPDDRIRFETVRGGVSRLLLALPAPAADHRDFPSLRMLCALLTGGRSGRLNDRLVERESLCGWVSASPGEGELAGSVQIAAELVPGADRARVETIVLEELAELRNTVVDDTRLSRTRRLVEADWVFAHERIESQALTLTQACALAGPGYPDEQLAAIARLDGPSLRLSARRYLDPEQGSVLGWSVAEIS